MEPKKFSKKLLKRLPAYLDYLKSLPEDVENVSATTMAKSLELGEVQVRKDLACVSGAGRQKVGRPRKQLIGEIESFLNLATKTGAVVVGVGNLGRALLEYNGFAEFGMNVMAGFDVEPHGKYLRTGKAIHSMGRLRSFCRIHQVVIGIIAVPAESAQDVCDHLVECGVKAIWNFAPTPLTVPEHVVLRSENLALSLTSLRLELINRTTSE
jgi:redox-sensing transcriptional repressor